ncbi:MAG: hypothetical protein K9K63_18720, partial [Desulfotignum sp.]|nr:hypothetical protein [Desulfotignum sp.]
MVDNSPVKGWDFVLAQKGFETSHGGQQPHRHHHNGQITDQRRQGHPDPCPHMIPKGLRYHQRQQRPRSQSGRQTQHQAHEKKMDHL